MKTDPWIMLTLDATDDARLIGAIRKVGIRPLARLAKISPTTLTRWLAGGYPVSLAVFVAICTAAIELGCGLDAAIGGQG